MAEDQQFYRQFLQSTGDDGGQTIREVVSPTLLDHDAAVAAEKQAGRSFTGFVAPDKMAGVGAPAAPAVPPPPPPAEPSEPPPLPSRVTPVSGAVPAGYSVAQPGSSPWLNMIPPVLAAAGPTALSIFQPELGLPLWAASAALAAGGGGGGEAIREKLAGEPISPTNIGEQAGVSALTDVGGQIVAPYAAPVIKAVGGRLFPTLGAVEQLGPVLATREAATAAAPTVSNLAGQGAAAVQSASEPAFDAARAAGSGLPVQTAGLAPHVTAATDALANAGANPNQLQQFGSVVSPMMTGEPTDYVSLMGHQRQLENWISGMRAQGVDAAGVAPLERLHGAVGAQLDAAAQGTAAAPMHAQYVAAQGEQLPQRYALSSLASHGTDLASQDAATLRAVALQASDAERPALAAAWVDSARQAAAQSPNPVIAMRGQYDALGPQTQTALFGTQRGAFERILQTAWGGTMADVGRLGQSTAFPSAVGGGARFFGVSHVVPHVAAGVGTLDLATPFVARGALMQPPVAAFGANLSRATGVAAPMVGRLGAQTYAERARQAGLPF